MIDKNFLSTYSHQINFAFNLGKIHLLQPKGLLHEM